MSITNPYPHLPFSFHSSSNLHPPLSFTPPFFSQSSPSSLLFAIPLSLHFLHQRFTSHTHLFELTTSPRPITLSTNPVASVLWLTSFILLSLKLIPYTTPLHLPHTIFLAPPTFPINPLLSHFPPNCLIKTIFILSLLPHPHPSHQTVIILLF